MIIKQPQYILVRKSLNKILREYRTPRISIKEISQQYYDGGEEGVFLGIKKYCQRQAYEQALEHSKKLARFKKSSKNIWGIRFPKNSSYRDFNFAQFFVSRVKEIELEHGKGSYFPLALTHNEKERFARQAGETK